MSLHLDARQRAMLAEMGVKLWARPGVPAASDAIESEAARADLTRAEGQNAPNPQNERSAPSALPAPAVEHPLTTTLTPVEPAAAAAPPVAQGPSRPSVSAASGGQTPIALVPPPHGVGQMDWATLQATVAECRACALCAARTQTVFGVGSPTASWMVVGEAPGEQEDRRGEPFVGQAGKLLDQMLAALGLTREAPNTAIESEAARAIGSRASRPNRLKSDVYIANVIKCRPPGNRNPEAAEIAQCEPYLSRQVALVRPRIILAMGRFAVHSLLQTTEPIGRLRGRVHQYQGVPVVVTYHPAYLLRALPEKAKAWDDLCLALDVMQSQPSSD